MNEPNLKNEGVLRSPECGESKAEIKIFGQIFNLFGSYSPHSDLEPHFNTLSRFTYNGSIVYIQYICTKVVVERRK